MIKILKRTRYFTKKGLQLRFAFIISMAMILLVLVIGISIYFTLWNNILKEIENTNNVQFESVVEGLFFNVTRLLVLESVVLIIGAAILSIFISHRFVGPLFKFQQAMKAMAKSILPSRIKLRKSDELQDFAADMNDMIDNLKSIIAENECIAEQIRLLADHLHSISSGKHPDRADMGKIGEELKMLSKKMGKTAENKNDEN